MFGIFLNKYSRYFIGFSLFSLAVSTILYIVALAFAPRAVAENKKFFLPITKGFILLSALLLLSSVLPSRR
jgi:hypothetical protein